MSEIEKNFFFDLPLDVGQMLGFSLKCLRDYAVEAPLVIDNIEWSEKSLTSYRSGAQFVPTETKVVSSYCRVPLVESYCKKNQTFLIQVDRDILVYQINSDKLDEMMRHEIEWSMLLSLRVQICLLSSEEFLFPCYQRLVSCV